MARVLVVKHLNSLRPVDEAAERVFRGLGQGEIVTVELKRERNIQNHRRLFAMLQIVLENQEQYASIDDLLDAMKIAIGHVKTLEVGGVLVKIPKSISFAALDEDAFMAEVYWPGCNWVITEVIPGLGQDDLDGEVAEELRRFGGGE